MRLQTLILLTINFKLPRPAVIVVNTIDTDHIRVANSTTHGTLVEHFCTHISSMHCMYLAYQFMLSFNSEV